MSEPHGGPSPAFDEEFREQLGALFAWRRDVRRFKSDPVPDALIAELLALAALSPSVGNAQPWRWVSVASPGRREQVAAAFEAANARAAGTYDDDRRAAYLALKLEGLRTAPVHLAVLCDEATALGHGLGRQTMPEMLAYSTVLSVHTFWLAARAHGLGVGWVSILDPAAVTRLLDVPDGWRLVAYLCVGWPVEEHIDPELQRFGWQDRAPLVLLRR
ncbi:MAG: 5,6-dimethylbenzimidazole synthase [Hyphomicrobiaceae bacterium]|nr:5,6-dimethylbenzimidazole synthase [Hyphomicrobiaceae bacterium]